MVYLFLLSMQRPSLRLAYARTRRATGSLRINLCCQNHILRSIGHIVNVLYLALRVPLASALAAVQFIVSWIFMIDPLLLSQHLISVFRTLSCMRRHRRYPTTISIGALPLKSRLSSHSTHGAVIKLTTITLLHPPSLTAAPQRHASALTPCVHTVGILICTLLPAQRPRCSG